MGKSIRGAHLIRLVIYLLVIVLINVAGLTLFSRWDLTANRSFSISDVSKEVVATLAEPLTIDVFFTKDLPAPHNNTERYLHDLLSEYAAGSNKFFNYRFHNVSPAEGSAADGGQSNRDLAENYGIRPVQIQMIEKDEVKFQHAYMGLVIIHGDMIETIPTITTVDGLEYKLTTAIRKLNNKISALAALDGKIKVRLFQSASLDAVAPYMKLNQLPQLPQKIQEVVEKLNGLHFGKMSFEHLDPGKDESLASEVKEYKLMTLNWKALEDGKVPAGSGTIGLVLEYGEKVLAIPLMTVLTLPIIGTHYELAKVEELETIISENIETLIDINEDLGYLADHGTLPLFGGGPMGQQVPDAAGTFNQLASQNYSLQNVELTEEGIPESLNTLVIARPTEPFNDWELFQIDQFLMKGNSLGIFLDSFVQGPPSQQNMMLGGQGPQYQPLDTGLERLLAHWGVRINRSLVMDKNCYKQQVPQQFGGGEQPLYFAPLIKSRNINSELPFIKDVKGLVALAISPLEVDIERLKETGLTAHRLFASSHQAWEMRDQINLNPRFAQPPPPAEDMQQFPLGYMITGGFPSYFEGKSVPEKPAPKKDEAQGPKDPAAQPPKEGADEKPEEAKPDPELAKIKGSEQIIARGKAGKIILIGSGQMISDSVLDEDGRSPNAILAMNILDTLNNKDAIAVMRSKQQQFNPLGDPPPGLRNIVKAFCIAGLPVLVILFGLLVWLRRSSRKKQIQMMFAK